LDSLVGLPANSEGNRLFLQRIGSSNEAFAEPFDFELTAGHRHYHLANLFALQAGALPHWAASNSRLPTGLTKKGRAPVDARPCCLGF
jgi:hypothetical protein